MIILLVVVCCSCAVKHRTLTRVQDWSYPVGQMDDQLSFSYVDNILEKTNNKQGARWAKRKNIHVVSIRLINNSKHPIHGTQLSFFNGDEQVELVHNEWLAKKVRQRFSPLMVLFFPIALIEQAIYERAADNEYDDGVEHESITMSFAEQVDDFRIKENSTLKDELMNFQLANQILMPGKPVYGIIGVRSKSELKTLRAVCRNSNFEILSNQLQ
ncbi:hypothetical protein [uncultured Sunxiuqinia sp.]|uniref:hypothetical protein n=1 Tax=uncultured Sunxiuqinia sp. TaxID=1573825 RepID=UPI0026102820|nr:hypothetical protein [uncultured Sunxiuqinia sp.]